MKGISNLSRGALKLSSKALNEITGGGQYCYLVANLRPPGPQGKVQLNVMNSGPLPLERCHVVTHRNLPYKPPMETPKTPEEIKKYGQDFERQFNLAFVPIVVRELGPLPPGSRTPGSVQGVTTDILLEVGSYYIQIYTRDDWFYETLTIRKPSNNEPFQTIVVKDEKGEVLPTQP
jgi:hypothetical protein